jgi:hypothetical protein
VEIEALVTVALCELGPPTRLRFGNIDMTLCESDCGICSVRRARYLAFR